MVKNDLINKGNKCSLLDLVSSCGGWDCVTHPSSERLEPDHKINHTLQCRIFNVKKRVGSLTFKRQKSIAAFSSRFL